MVSSDVRKILKKVFLWVGAIVARYYFRNSFTPKVFFDRVNVLISFPNLFFRSIIPLTSHNPPSSKYNSKLHPPNL